MFIILLLMGTVQRFATNEDDTPRFLYGKGRSN